MDFNINKIFFLLLLFNIAYADISRNNETEEDRQPRVSGRIVKLYTGSRAEPIYCPKEGFQADPANCAIFYRCVKGPNNKFTVFRFQCGPGTVYDPDTEVCNFPRSTKRSECGGVLLPSLDGNKENEIEGPQPELPTPITNRPIYLEPGKGNISDYLRPLAVPEKTSSTTVLYHMTASSDEFFTKRPEFQSQPSKHGDEICTRDGFVGDSDNCHKFYRCVGNQRGGFIRYEFSCSETTVWDDEVQSCNHPWAVQRSRCGRSQSKNNIKSSKRGNQDKQTIQEQLQINYGDKVTQSQTQISHGQVIQNQTQINYENNNNKNSEVRQNQTQISHGSAVSQTQTQLNYGNGIQTQLQVDHTKDSSQAQVQNYETTSKSSTTQQHEIDNGYSTQSTIQDNEDKDNSGNECSESGFMGDKYDCKKFYRCVDNGKQGYTKYEFSCGEGTVWDSSTETCNHAWAVKKCGGNVSQNSPQGDFSTTTTIKTTENYQTTPESVTSDNIGDSGYGNQNQQSETTTSTSTTQPKPDKVSGDNNSDGTTCTSSGFKGDPNDCKKFYRCVDNGKNSYTKYEYICGEGTVWDPDIEACNHPWAVEKCGGTATDVNKTETSTAQSTAITVSLVHTTTFSSENVDNSGYGQQSSETSTLSSTTKKPQYTDGNNCKTSGFFGDKNDCKRFYRCVDNGNGGYTRYDFSCGEGTVWDTKIEGCNHVWAVEKCGASSTQGENSSQITTSPGPENEIITTQSTGSLSTEPSNSKPSSDKKCTHEGFMGDETDCKKFYRCVDNGQGGFIKYEFSCGDGTVWDSEIVACNHQTTNTSCSVSNNSSSHRPDQVVSTEPNRENDEIYSEPTTSSQSSTAQSQTTATSQKPQIINEKCVSEGFYGSLDNCKMFYRCVDNGKGGYTKYEFSCGDGTIWDQEIQACNHEPKGSTCSKDSQNSPAQSETTDTGGTSTSSESTAEQQSTSKPPNESSDICSSEGFYANTADCKKFYRCVDNGKGGFTKYDFSCGEGTMWIQEIQACDHDTGESCESRNEYSTTTKMDNIYDSSSQKPDKQEDENPNHTSSETNSPNENAKECTSEGFYPNKKDCKKFYRCVDNGDRTYTKYDFDCGEGTAWDSDIQTCNHISEVKNCQEQESTQPLQDEKPQSSSSSNTAQTSSSEPATESSKPSNEDTCKEEGYYGNSQDCTKFYRCVDNGKGGLTKYDFACGEGTIWDQDVTTCNHPQDVSNPSCQQTNNSDSSSSSTTSSSSSSSESSSSTTESGSSDCSQGSTKKPDNKNVNCTKAGYYPDENDCKKFYRCVDWDGDGKRFSVYHFECGEGTIWDPALDTCNHEDSVYPRRDCSGGTQSQGENVQQQSTTESSSTTSETEMTTQESTTTDQTQESTTEQTTTSEHTAQESTTEQITTSQQTTTEKTTTENLTSQQTTTEKSTEEQTTTDTSEQTTAQTTNEQTTQESTTQEVTTQQSDATEHTTSTIESATQSTTESEGTTAETSTTESSTTESSTTEETTTENNTTEASTTEKTTTQGTTEQSTTDQTDESGTTESNLSTTSQNNDSSTTESEQESTTESGGGETESNSSEQECPKTDDDQNLFVCPTSFRRHPKYCNMFYQCTEDDDTHDVQIATFRCPNDTIYDESKTKCVEEKKADKKCDGEIAQKRRLKRFDTTYKEPVIVTNERLKCPAPGHYPFEKGECSQAFLKCQKTKSGKMRGFVYKCPQEYVYWAVSRRCELKTNLRDCKNSHHDWKGRWEIPIERRNVAP